MSLITAQQIEDTKDTNVSYIPSNIYPVDQIIYIAPMKNIIHKMSTVSVNPVKIKILKNETSAQALGSVEVGQRFASLRQAQLNKKY